MPAIQSRDDVVRVVQSLPEGASLDDVIERLILLRKVELGLAEKGSGLPQSAARAEFAKPRADRLWNRG